MSSIASDNGRVEIRWDHGYNGGQGGRSTDFCGYERLTENEFITLNNALMNDEFLEQVQDWSRKDEFVRKLKGK